MDRQRVRHVLGDPGFVSKALEVGALGDLHALKIAAQTVEAEVNGTEPHPVATAIDARATGFRPFLRSEREMNAAAEIDVVGSPRCKTGLCVFVLGSIKAH
jgi:hypothetical protein